MLGAWGEQMMGVPYTATVEEIREFFADYAVVDEGICILLQDDNRASGIVRPHQHRQDVEALHAWSDARSA